MIIGGIAILALAVGGGFAFAHRHAGSPLEADLLAVAPFEVLDPSLQLWHEGIVDMLSRDLDGAAKHIVKRLDQWRQSTGRPIVAIDVPSGLDGTTGAIRGACLQATETVTFFRFKPGHLLLPGRVNCGVLTLADIGIPESVLDEIAPKTFVNAPELWRGALRFPQLQGHKYSRGHAVIVSGRMPETGAARLAARGALRAGAGLVTVASPRDALAVHAASLTAIMVRESEGPAGLARLLADPRKNAIVLGPGLGIGEETCALAATALSPGTASRACVLDADALTSFAGQKERLFAAIHASAGPGRAFRGRARSSRRRRPGRRTGASRARRARRRSPAPPPRRPCARSRA